jgi:hypothetical protein
MCTTVVKAAPCILDSSLSTFTLAPSVPTHNENHNYHDPSNTCIHDMNHAHANTVTPIFVPKATLLPEVIVKPHGKNNTNVGHNNIGYTKDEQGESIF